ncbi:hypothetical protein [Sandarakinorhabdus sp. AAP62]|uniref:hypothetical protein n=1 Tax=Sandarakinorhabdus sp. AAP62 TaxID=1248916 RepID=UPI00031475F2|nr:hypothetical protein [Sandarakinorhabdus sp. AAP62]
MRRILGFVVALAGLLGAGLIIWRAPPVTQPAAALAVADPPAVDASATPLAAPRSPLSDAEREARRLKRYDKNRDSAVDRTEFLSNRRKSFDRADRNKDGRLDFEEFAAATATKFARADRNADGQLNAKEFATTAIKRKPKAACVCPVPDED